MKKEKGITLITLVVTVSILIILSSILVYNTKNSTKIKNLKMMYNDIEILDDEIDQYYLKYGDIPTKCEFFGDATNGFKLQKQPNDNDKYYVIDLSALEGITLNYGLENNKITDASQTGSFNDVYIINEASHHIYYVRGIELDGKMYYTNDTDVKQVKLKL